MVAVEWLCLCYNYVGLTACSALGRLSNSLPLKPSNGFK